MVGDKGENATSARWHVTLCNPTWHDIVSFGSGKAGCKPANCHTLLLTFSLLTVSTAFADVRPTTLNNLYYHYITAATIATAAATTTTSTTDTDTYGYGYLHAAIQQRQTLHGTCLKSL